VILLLREEFSNLSGKREFAERLALADTIAVIIEVPDMSKPEAGKS